MRNMHADQAGIKKIACTICGEEFVRQFYLKKHMALKVGSYLTPFLALHWGYKGLDLFLETSYLSQILAWEKILIQVSADITCNWLFIIVLIFLLKKVEK